MQRKATKTTRGANSAEKEFQGWLKNQECCITGEHGVQVHHCKGSTFKHNKVLIGHWYCLPLSPDKHAEYHAGTKSFQAKYGSQAELWLECYHSGWFGDHEPPNDVFLAICDLAGKL